MKKIALGAAVLVSGLLFCSINVKANNKESYIWWPTAGFKAYMSEIECKPAKHLPSYILTEEDADLLLRIGVCEAGETDPEAIADVMQVVLNRFESDIFPNSIYEVVYQEKQFSSTRRLAKANITDAAYEALDAVCMGEYRDNEALYFESLEGKVWAKCHNYLFSYGGHDFYN